MAKLVYVLSGVSGTGKSYLRQTTWLGEFPCLDVADLYDEFPELDWHPVFEVFLKRLRQLLEEHDTVVVEGYFSRHSTSLEMLLDDLQVIGATPQIIRLWAPLRVCQDRLLSEELTASSASRFEMLARCWRPE